jgi:hypothetical protein
MDRYTVQDRIWHSGLIPLIKGFWNDMFSDFSVHTSRDELV